MKNSERIPAIQTEEFPRWELPEVNEGQIIQAEKTRRDVAKGNAPSIDKSLVVYSKLTVGEIENISQRIQKDIEKEAYQVGLKKGLDKGYKAGLQKGQQQIQQHLASLQSIIASLNDALQQQDDQVEKTLVNLSVSVAESVLRRELVIDSSHIVDVIHDSIAAINAEAKKVDVYLSAQDFKFVNTMGNMDENWQLHQDASLSAGGCRVANRYSVSEYSAEQQFEQMVSQLVDARYAELDRQTFAGNGGQDTQTE